MTVSTITGGVPEFKRALENQNRTSIQKTDEAKAQAPLPSDTVEASAAPHQLLAQADAIAQTQAQNLEAAQSTLQESDLDVLAREATAQEKIQSDALAATRAQTKRLPPSMLELLTE